MVKQAIQNNEQSLALSQLEDLLECAFQIPEVETFSADWRDGKYEKNPHIGVNKARRVLGNIFADILKEPLEKILNLNKYQTAVDKMEDECKKCRKNLTQLLKHINQDDVMAILQPHGDFIKRLNKNLSEKQILAKHVVKSYFHNTDIRCFIQASTLAVLLAQEIVHQEARSLLIHTNSFFMAPIALQAENNRIIYNLCGGDCDDVCGGWLFRPDDKQAKEELQRLFNRDSQKLDTAFLMPLNVTTDGDLYYYEHNAKLLVSLLVEYAPKIRILAVAERIWDSNGKEDELGRYKVTLPEKNENKDVKLIVAGRPRAEYQKSAQFESLKSAFEDREIHVEWIAHEIDGEDNQK